jgi:hypothetical protein
MSWYNQEDPNDRRELARRATQVFEQHTSRRRQIGLERHVPAPKTVWDENVLAPAPAFTHIDLENPYARGEQIDPTSRPPSADPERWKARFRDGLPPPPPPPPPIREQDILEACAELGLDPRKQNPESILAELEHRIREGYIIPAHRRVVEREARARSLVPQHLLDAQNQQNNPPETKSWKKKRPNQQATPTSQGQTRPAYPYQPPQQGVQPYPYKLEMPMSWAGLVPDLSQAEPTPPPPSSRLRPQQPIVPSFDIPEFNPGYQEPEGEEPMPPLSQSQRRRMRRKKSKGYSPAPFPLPQDARQPHAPSQNGTPSPNTSVEQVGYLDEDVKIPATYTPGQPVYPTDPNLNIPLHAECGQQARVHLASGYVTLVCTMTPYPHIGQPHLFAVPQESIEGAAEMFIGWYAEGE